MITLSTVRRHLNAELFEEEEREYVMEQLLPAARETAASFLNRELYDTDEQRAAAIADGTAGDYPLVAPRAVDQAILLLLGHLYRNREAVTTGLSELPLGAFNLLYPHRVRMGV